LSCNLHFLGTDDLAANPAVRYWSDGNIWSPRDKNCQVMKVPLFAGYDASMVVRRHHTLGLPPLFITGIGHVKDVTITERHSTSRQTAVSRRVIVKQCSAHTAHSMALTRPFLRPMHIYHGPQSFIIRQRRSSQKSLDWG